MSRQLKMMRLDEFQAYPKNAKEHDVGLIAQSMMDHGYIAPIIFNEDNGLIVAGHGRIKALIELKRQNIVPKNIEVDDDGQWLVPTVIGNMSDDDHDIYALIDNRLVEQGGWDQLKLKDILTEIAESGRDIEKTGFDLDFLNDLHLSLSEVPPSTEPEGEDDQKPDYNLEVDEGDIYVLNDKHIIACGSCTDPEFVNAVLGDERPALLITDPPYGVSYEDHLDHLKKYRTPNLKRVDDKVSGDQHDEDLDQLLYDAFSLIHGYLAHRSSFYVFTAGSTLMRFWNGLEDTQFLPKYILVWDKINPALSMADFNFVHEPFIFGWKKGGVHDFYVDNAQSIIRIKKNLANDLHPTQKPCELYQELIKYSSAVTQTVVDIFGGSCVLIDACINLNRKGICIEKNPVYVQEAIKYYKSKGVKVEKRT